MLCDTAEKTMGRVVVILALTVAVLAVGWNLLTEKRFERSFYGKEIQGMMSVCISMQTDGRLPGIGAGENPSLRFSSGGVEFSEKDNPRYPLALDCRIEGEGAEAVFTFRKKTPGGKWILAE